jgi:two-component system sensor histidine kinase QseC
MIKSPHSLQGRLLAMVIGVVAVVWMIAGIATWFDVRHELDELLDSHLAQAAALLVVQQSGEIEDEHGVDTPTLHRYAPKVAFQVFHEGRLVLRSLNAPAAPMTPSGGDFRSGFATIQINGTAWRVFATHGAEQDVQVFVGESTDSRDAILWAALRSTLWPMAVALPLLALALWWAIYGGLAPMRLLGQRLAQRQPQELHPFEFDGITAEMAPMVDSLNTLFKRIDILLESERRFTADAAHELRTPLAAIRAQAQVALGEADDSRRQVALRGTIDGCDRAARLVEQLLTLSRLEAAAAPAMTIIDLSALSRRTIAEIAPKAIGKNQQIELEATDHCHIRGDETLMEVLIRNLVDNAIRYSPPFAHIRIAMQEKDGSVALSVEDSGPGLDEVDRSRLGERFFRVAGSSESGSGLGWSIVRRIAALHRLDVQIGRSRDLGGFAVRLTSSSNGIVLDSEPTSA